MISIVLPTLKRMDLAISAVHNLYKKAENPEQVEVMLAFKSDDLSSLTRLEELPEYPNLRFMTFNYDFGYKNLHDITNAAMQRCRGMIMGLWNDDAIMLTRGWDNRIASTAYRHPWSVIQIGSFTQFPFVSRKVFQVMGHYALHYSLDDYITGVARSAGIEYRTPVFVHHDHKKDDIVAEERDETTAYMFATLHSVATQTLIQNDSTNIREAMKNEQNKYDEMCNMRNNDKQRTTVRRQLQG